MTSKIRRLLDIGLGPFFTKHLLLHKRQLSITIVVLISQAVFAVVLPWPMKFILDKVLSGKPGEGLFEGHTSLELLAVGVGLFFVTQLVAVVMEFFELYWLSRTSNSIVESARRDIAKIFATRRHDFISGRRKADLVGRLSQDTANMDILLQTGLTVAVRSFPSVVFIGIALSSVTPWFAVTILAVIVLMLYLTKYYAQQVKKYRKLFRGDITNLEQTSLQSLQAYSLSKSSSLGFQFRVRMAKAARQASNHTLQTAVSEGMLSAWIVGIKTLMKVMILAIGGYLVFQGKLTAGAIILFLSYVDTVGRAMNDLNKFAQKAAKSFASLERIQELLTEAEAYPEPRMGKERLAAPVNSFEFRDVTFGYQNGTSTIEKFSHRFRSGEVTALLGPSGCGKSTILYLAKRFYAPRSGEIFFNEQNMAQVEGNFIRNSIQYVSQDIQILRGTVRENIAYDNSLNLSDESIWEALRATNAEKFVRELPLGLDTIIGDGGQSLSFGQSKRICLARAFIPPRASIYLFDEPTSGIDRDSADLLLASIRKLGDSGAMVIFTTHNKPDLEFAHSSVSVEGTSASLPVFQ